MSKEKRTIGTGSLALLLAFISILSLIKVNGSAIFDYLFGVAGMTSHFITPSIVLVLAAAGIFIGLRHKQDWGSKVGGILCALNILTCITLYIDLLA